MTPIAYALAVYHEARRRVWWRSLMATGVEGRGCACDYCRTVLAAAIAIVTAEAKAAEEAARRKR